MWPWGHFGVAYIVYSLYSRGRFGRSPRPEPALAAIFGSQFADLIDKPLGWLGVFPHGRFLAHSLLATGIVILAVYAAAIALDRLETATAFVLAHLAHLVADIPPRAYLGYPNDTEFLFWPFLSHPTFTYHERLFEPPAIVEFVVTPFTHPGIFFLLEIPLFAAGLTLWYLDGCPGLDYVRSRR